MRNQRTRKVRFKKGKIYTIRRSIVLVVAILFLLLLIKLLFFSKRDSITEIADINSITSNTKVETTNESSENKTVENSVTENAIAKENTTSNENTVANTVAEANISSDVSKDNELSEDVTFSMAVTGDIMCHNTMYQDAYDSSTKSYDFSYMFENIKNHLQTADISVGNLETTFAGSKVGYSGYPTFNTPEALAKNLKKAGLNVVSTANNHCMDKGYSGIVSTIKYLDEADIAHTGTFTSKEDQEDVLVMYTKGVSIAFLSFTYGTNGISIPKDKSYAVNLIDKDLIKKQIDLAKKKNPDVLCVCMHWGIEYQTTPNNTQKDLADYLFKNGVDVIIGNHPHVPQPMEKRTITLGDGSKKDGLVIYSLGNFMANQNKKYTCDSAIVKIKITKKAETGKIAIDSATYVPTYCYKDTSKKTKKFKILDIQNTISAYDSGYDTSIGKSLYNTLSDELKNIKKIIGKEYIAKKEEV